MYVTESVKEVNFRLLKGAPLRAHVIVKLHAFSLRVKEMYQVNVDSERKRQKITHRNMTMANIKLGNLTTMTRKCMSECPRSNVT